MNTSDEVIMIDKNGPRLKLPLMLLCKRKQVVFKQAQPLSGGEEMLFVQRSSGNYVDSVGTDAVNRRMRPIFDWGHEVSPLECADVSALGRLGPVAAFAGELKCSPKRRRQAAADQSGDTSPHCKVTAVERGDSK